MYIYIYMKNINVNMCNCKKHANNSKYEKGMFVPHA